MEDKIFNPHIITFRIINRKFLNEQCQFLGIFLFNRFCHSLVCSNLYIVIEAIEDTALSDTFYGIIRIDDDSAFGHLAIIGELLDIGDNIIAFDVMIYHHTDTLFSIGVCHFDFCADGELNICLDVLFVESGDFLSKTFHHFCVS